MSIYISIAISALGVIISFVFSLAIYKRNIVSDGKHTGELHADTQYIKKRIDDVLLEQKDTNRKMDTLSERVTRVEESVKQAHRRIDELKRSKI